MYQGLQRNAFWKPLSTYLKTFKKHPFETPGMFSFFVVFFCRFSWCLLLSFFFALLFGLKSALGGARCFAAQVSSKTGQAVPGDVSNSLEDL